jgi:hypothetical protein
LKEPTCAASNLSFRVGSTLVKTNASTQFKDAACASLKAGDSVEVKGAQQTDNSVLATRVERKKSHRANLRSRLPTSA